MNTYIFAGIISILSGVLKILLRFFFPDAFVGESYTTKLWERFTIVAFIVLGIVSIIKGYVNPAQETIKGLEVEVTYEDRI